jgi:hypothetical protein
MIDSTTRKARLISYDFFRNETRRPFPCLGWTTPADSAARASPCLSAGRPQMLNVQPACRQVPNVQNAMTAANIIEKRMILRVSSSPRPDETRKTNHFHAC